MMKQDTFYWVVSFFTWYIWRMVDMILLYFLESVCMWVLITSAGCVTTAAMLPAARPQTKYNCGWRVSSYTPGKENVTRLSFLHKLGHLWIFYCLKLILTTCIFSIFFSVTTNTRQKADVSTTLLGQAYSLLTEL